MLLGFGLPISLQGMSLDPEAILSATRSDKKMDSGMIQFVLLRQIGEAVIDRTVSDEELIDTILWLSGGNL